MDKDRLGYYLVGWKKFYNKTLALMESKATGYDVLWMFNDDVYGSFNWSVPIPETLDELYKKRAQQLREKYDYLILLYSGGADSSQALLSFINNNIFIDEIVMHLPEVFKAKSNNTDKSNGNMWSEIEHSAIPFLNKLKNRLDPRTKIKIHDFSKTGLQSLEKDDWSELRRVGMSFNISAILKQGYFTNEKDLVSLYETKRSVAFIEGIDKPLVYFDGKDYYCFFMDTSAYHVMSPLEFSDEGKSNNNYFTEFFYWSRDMPQIVIKQAQEIKYSCEVNQWTKFMASKILTTHINEYRDVLHPIIYDKEIILDFQTEKPSTKIIRPMDNWFWQTTSKKVQGHYLETIDYFKNNIDSKHGIGGDVLNGFSAVKSKFYKL